MHLANSRVPGVGALYLGNELGNSRSASLIIESHLDSVYGVAMSPLDEPAECCS